MGKLMFLKNPTNRCQEAEDEPERSRRRAYKEKQREQPENAEAEPKRNHYKCKHQNPA